MAKVAVWGRGLGGFGFGFSFFVTFFSFGVRCVWGVFLRCLGGASACRTRRAFRAGPERRISRAGEQEGLERRKSRVESRALMRAVGLFSSRKKNETTKKL